MELATLLNMAVELGVIPVAALFLIYAMHRQNKKLLSMIEKQEENISTMMQKLITEIVLLTRDSGGRENNEN